MSVYFGTWTVFVQGNPNPISSSVFVQLTDRISGEVTAALQADGTVDGRVQAAAPGWLDPGQHGIQWAIAPPDNLPAVANFAASIAALGGSITTDSGFVSGGLRTYLLQSVDSTETGPVPAGDTDAPVIVGQLGDIVTVTNNFNAEVSFFERNGSVTLPANPVPEPGSAALLGIPLLALAAHRFRRGKVALGANPNP